MLSVWPTSFPERLPERGSHMRTTRSGPPDAMAWPNGSAARAYTEDFGADASAGFSVIRGSVGGTLLEAERVRSQSLIVRSKEPEATQFCERHAARQRT